MAAETKSMKLIKLLLFVLLSTASLFAQLVEEASAKKYYQDIRNEDLRRHLEILASDEFEGRETGTEGQRKAARYIADHFSSLGLPPLAQTDGYNQEVRLVKEKWDEVKISINGEDFGFMQDFFCMPRSVPEMKFSTKQVYFVGYGIEESRYSDYAGKSVEGKVLVMYKGEPKTKDGKFLLSGSNEASEWSSNWRKKLILAKSKGAKAVFVITPNLKRNIEIQRFRIMSNSMRLADPVSDDDRKYPPNFSISGKMAAKLLGYTPGRLNKLQSRLVTKGKGKPKKRKSNVSVDVTKDVEYTKTENVLGYLEGSDLKDEVLVITAHYDHLGKKGNRIYNGADDDGSGTSCVLEIAESFANAKAAGKGPRRSILFMAVSGEEKGLLGSEYYSENPIFPLSKTVANLNIDMVGRTDDLHKDDKQNYVYVIGADRLSTELHDINDRLNQQYTKLNLDYTYNEPDDPNRFYYRSDHYNFAKHNIPVIFYFNGTHDDYHQPTDTVEKIDFDRMRERAQLIFLTAWQLVNQDHRIEVDVPQE